MLGKTKKPALVFAATFYVALSFCACLHVSAAPTSDAATVTPGPIDNGASLPAPAPSTVTPEALDAGFQQVLGASPAMPPAQTQPQKETTVGTSSTLLPDVLKKFQETLQAGAPGTKAVSEVKPLAPDNVGVGANPTNSVNALAPSAPAVSPATMDAGFQEVLGANPASQPAQNQPQKEIAVEIPTPPQSAPIKSEELSSGNSPVIPQPEAVTAQAPNSETGIKGIDQDIQSPPPSAPKTEMVVQPQNQVASKDIEANVAADLKKDASSQNKQNAGEESKSSAAATNPVEDSVLGGAYLRSLNGNNGVISVVALEPSISPDVTVPLYLSEAVAFSLENDYEIQASRSKVKQSWYNKLGAYSEFAPSAQYSVSSGNEYSAPAAVNDINGNRVQGSIHPLLERSLTIRQPLIDLNVIADVLATHTDESIAEEELRDTREGAAFDTANVFLKLVQAHLAVQLADQYKAYLDNLSKLMTVRLEGGGATKADLERIKGRATSAESAKIEAMGEYRSDLSEFTRLTKVVPAQLQIPDMLSPPLPDNVQAALERATTQNPSYLSSLKKIDAAADERNKYVSGALPKLSFQYTRSFTYDSGDSAFGNPVDGVFPDQQTDTWMLVASWAINGGTAIASGLAGTEKEREMRFKSQDVRARLEQSIRTSYEAVNTARRRITILQQAIKSDARVVQDFEAQFKEGSRTLFDLLDAYEQLYVARLNLLRVIVAEAQASFQIRRQMGDLADAVRTVGEP